MYVQDKAMQYCFYLGVLILFVFAMCYFSTSGIDERRSTDARTRIEHSEKLNREVQNRIEVSKTKISGTITGIGNAETELDRAKSSIARCESILERAKQRTQETGKQN